MRGKPVTSVERAIIFNVFKHLKGNFPLESQRSIIERTSKATGSSISTIKRIIKEERPRSPGKKRPNRKKFTKLDSFDLSVIRRIIHSFNSRNESPTLTKLLKKLKEEINFPYGRTHLFRLLKTLGFKYKKRGRESILNEKSDLIMWRESFLRRIREVREKEPQREIVYTDETWLNGGHRVKKEWVDLKTLENPRRSIKEYGTVGCTKDNVGKGKRIIIVDCITENGPVPVLSGYFQQARSHKKKSRKYHSRRLQLPSKKQRKPCTQSKNRIAGLKMCHLPLRLGQQRESPRQMNHLRNQKKSKKGHRHEKTPKQPKL